MGRTMEAPAAQWEHCETQWECDDLLWDYDIFQREVPDAQWERPAPRRRGGRLAAVALLLAAALGCAWALADWLDALPLWPGAAYGAAQAGTNTPGAPKVMYPVRDTPAPAGFEDEMGGTNAMVPVLQTPELTNGCEATALATVLQFYGYPADKCDLAYDYIPREDLVGSGEGRQGPDPATAYAGDPATRTGFYCFAAPLAEGANLYLEEAGATLRAVDISGAGREEIDAELAAGRPVILWVSLDYSAEPRWLEGSRWTLPDGTLYTPYANLHCVALAGLRDGQYRVCDPVQGEMWADAEQLYQSYLALGGHAVAFDG